ncbi:MAG: DUF3515 family protein [Kineosporiaceae bacterium]
MSASGWRPAALAPALALLLVTGCSEGEAGLAAGPRRDDPACTRLSAALPPTVLGGSRVGDDDRGDARWGSPAVVLGCGHTPPGPSTRACLGVDGVDWLVDDPEADPIRFTSYGRDPAVVVLVPARYGRERASEALADLAGAVAGLPREGPGCS